jgi:hypothetical protein
VEIASEISFINTRCGIIERQLISARSIPGSINITTKVSPRRPPSDVLLTLVPYLIRPLGVCPVLCSLTNSHRKAIMQSCPPETEELRISLIHLYTAVLGLLTQSKHYFDQHTVKRLACGALKGTTDVEDFMTTVEKCRADVDRCLMLVISARQISVSGQVSKLNSVSEDAVRLCERLSAELVAPIARMDQSMTNMTDALDRKERLRILLWLSSQSHLLHHKQSKKGLISGTGT